ncbi:MAG: response regulator transcription factor [Chitinophagaceae bacterium]|nr:MAG: response regulator transcription factor [Chitinophagaceae bacterium]
MIRCVIIDDEKPAITVIERCIERLPELQLIGSARDPLIGLEMIRKEKPDVVFLDIQMRQMNGIELAKAVGQTTRIVFCTAYFEYAVQSYELNAVDYLVKPIEFPRFKIAVQKISDAITGRITPVEAIKDDYILVKYGERGYLKKIDFDDIVYIQAMNNYVSFFCPPQKTLAYMTLKELEDRLPACGFVRVHKSYIVSIKYIHEVRNNEILMKKNDKPVPIGRNYKDSFWGKINGRQI